MQPMTKKNTPPQANARRPVHRPSHPHSNRAGASAGSPPNASTATLLPRPLGPPSLHPPPRSIHADSLRRGGDHSGSGNCNGHVL
uniref:B2 n=1 Tax=Human betaherpesvirus 6 TaxID=10368 RepID=A0A5P9S4W2_9BETA|nr:hypothetical protein [Human betaherpesvirus 6]QFV23702.1 hypothetical protein [Human betaherpesvirus 6]